MARGGDFMSFLIGEGTELYFLIALKNDWYVEFALGSWR